MDFSVTQFYAHARLHLNASKNSATYKNQSINLQCKSIDWFLYVAAEY